MSAAWALTCFVKAMSKGPSGPGDNMNDLCTCAVMEVNHILDHRSKTMANRLGEVTFPHHLAFVKPHLEVQLYSQSLQVWALEQEKSQTGESLVENLSKAVTPD